MSSCGLKEEGVGKERKVLFSGRVLTMAEQQQLDLSSSTRTIGRNIEPVVKGAQITYERIAKILIEGGRVNYVRRNEALESEGRRNVRRCFGLSQKLGDDGAREEKNFVTDCDSRVESIHRCYSRKLRDFLPKVERYFT
ncbi:hypothetical protein R1flu_015545 [Riccia fluitans]|uniref:Uncharacterized protein n=1 Tax=Riccia fluitans TaxID=41844 RepID=A0ABD1YJA2_9MARC